MAKGWSVSGVSACIPQCSIPNSIYMLILNVLQPHLPVQCDCSPSPSFPFPPSSFLSPLPSPPFPFPSPPPPFPLFSLPLHSFFLFTSLFFFPSTPHSLLLLSSTLSLC